VACKREGDKRDFFRIARGEDGSVIFDKTGRAKGRGAYLCRREECVELASRKKVLEVALKLDRPIDPSFYEILRDELRRAEGGRADVAQDPLGSRLRQEG